MVYGMAWQGMTWYVERHSITCFKALSWAIVPFTRGVADVSWRSCSHVLDPFTSRGHFTRVHACSVQTYSSCSLWEGIVNREIVNLYRSLFWDRYLDIHSYCVISVDQAFVIANTCKYQL